MEEDSQKNGIENASRIAEGALAEMFAWHGQRIKELEAENAKYAGMKANEAELKKKQKELRQRELELERKEKDILAHPDRYLFKDKSLFLWNVVYRAVDPPEETKCSKCDEDGYVHYLSPNGTRVRERCRCRWDYQEYYACRTRLVELHLCSGQEPVLFYKPEDGGDCFSTIMLDHNHRIYDGEQRFEELDPFRLLFRDEETARKYAEWCNEHRRTQVYNRSIQYEDK